VVTSSRAPGKYSISSSHTFKAQTNMPSSDPYFYLHHAQIDRTYWIWQNQNLAERQYAIAGTITLDNDPPSRNTTLEDIIELGVNAPEGITIKDAMSTMAGPFCYIYL